MPVTGDAMFIFLYERDINTYRMISLYSSNEYIVIVIKMKLKCKRCEYEWDYKGKRRFYATCPDCHTLVKLVLK